MTNKIRIKIYIYKKKYSKIKNHKFKQKFKKI